MGCKSDFSFLKEVICFQLVKWIFIQLYDVPRNPEEYNGQLYRTPLKDQGRNEVSSFVVALHNLSVTSLRASSVE